MRKPDRRTWTILGALLAAACSAPRDPAPRPQTLSYLERSAAARPGDAATWTALGRAYLAAGKPEGALPVLDSAVAADSTNIEALWFSAFALDILGRLDEARARYDAVAVTTTSGPVLSVIESRKALMARRELVASVRGEAGQVPNAQPDLIAIFPFAYSGQDSTLRPTGRSLAELVAGDLARLGLRVVEQRRFDLVLEQAQPATSPLTDATIDRVARAMGAGMVVQGEVMDADGIASLRLRLTARVVGAPTGDSVIATAPIPRVFEAETTAVAALVRVLGREPTPAQDSAFRRVATRSVLSMIAYGRGVEALAREDHVGALAHFRTAVDRDGRFRGAIDARRHASLLVDAMSGRPERVVDRLEGPTRRAIIRSRRDAALARAAPSRTGESGAEQAVARKPFQEGVGTEGGTRGGETTVIVVIKRP